MPKTTVHKHTAKSATKSRSMQRNQAAQTLPEGTIARLPMSRMASLQRAVGNQSLGQWAAQQPETIQRQTQKRSTLEKLTHFSFDWGNFHQEVKLPATISTLLPVSIRQVGRLEFKLEVSGAVVTFSATLNGKSSLQVAAYQSLDAFSGQMATGMKLSSQSKVRRTLDPLTAQERITQAGKQLTNALNNYKKASPEPGQPLAAGVEPNLKAPQNEMELLKAVAEAIRDMYTTVQAVQGQEVPVFELGLEARWSTGAGIKPPEERDRPGAVFGVMATWHF